MFSSAMVPSSIPTRYKNKRARAADADDEEYVSSASKRVKTSPLPSSRHIVCKKPACGPSSSLSAPSPSSSSALYITPPPSPAPPLYSNPFVPSTASFPAPSTSAALGGFDDYLFDLSRVAHIADSTLDAPTTGALFQGMPTPEDYVLHGQSSAIAEQSDAHPGENAGEHIPRPMNSFMLYRSEKRKYYEEGVKHQQSISKLISIAWKKEPAHVVAEYKRRAELLKKEHRRKYPTYKYQPGASKKAISSPKKKRPAKPAGEVERPTSSAARRGPSSATGAACSAIDLPLSLPIESPSLALSSVSPSSPFPSVSPSSLLDFPSLASPMPLALSAHSSLGFPSFDHSPSYQTDVVPFGAQQEMANFAQFDGVGSLLALPPFPAPQTQEQTQDMPPLLGEEFDFAGSAFDTPPFFSDFNANLDGLQAPQLVPAINVFATQEELANATPFADQAQYASVGDPWVSHGHMSLF